jgi:hypothetical protein
MQLALACRRSYSGDMSDFSPGDTECLSGTKSEGTVMASEGNSVTVKLLAGSLHVGLSSRACKACRAAGKKAVRQEGG